MNCVCQQNGSSTSYAILTLPQVQIVRLAQAEDIDEGMAVRDIVKEQDVRLALKNIAV